tara:strand:+ start:3586 stop:4716 length:1131 start_codon:yes stop_codon:yes gene_type:complete
MATQSEKDTKEPLKIKKKPRAKNLNKTNEITKIDIHAEKRQIEKDKEPTKIQLKSEEPAKVETKKVNVLEEVVDKPIEKEEVTEVITEKVVENIEPAKEIVEEQNSLPDNVGKLVSFMKETGGTVEDYVTLNKDYNKYDDKLLVKEFYKKTRPHLNEEEVNFVMKDNFTYDEEVDEERFVRKQKLAYKEEVAKAKNFLEQMKGKYYDEIKLRPSVTNEQKKAMDFLQQYNKEQSTIASRRSDFVNKTKTHFQNDFEGFNFNVGEKKFKYKLSNPEDISQNQTDVGKFINKFMDKNGNIEDLDGYHKAMYAARNTDKLAQHFYEQGKADATKDIVAKSKNINSTPKPMDTGETLPNGWKVRAISGADSTKLKIKKRT